MGAVYKLRRNRNEKTSQKRRKCLIKLAIITLIAVVAWQGWVRVSTIWPSWSPEPQPDPYKDCVFVDGPTQKDVAEICPDS